MTALSGLFPLFLILTVSIAISFLSAHFVLRRSEMPKRWQLLCGLLAIVSLYVPLFIVAEGSLPGWTLLIFLAISIGAVWYVMSKISARYGFDGKATAFLYLKIWGVFLLMTTVPTVLIKILTGLVKTFH